MSGRYQDMLAGKRADFLLIAEMVPQGARVLDVGCGDGQLLGQFRQPTHEP